MFQGLIYTMSSGHMQYKKIVHNILVLTHYNHYDISMTALLSNIASPTLVCPLEHDLNLKDVTNMFIITMQMLCEIWISCHILFVLLLRTDASLIFRILNLIYQTHKLSFLRAI